MKINIRCENVTITPSSNYSSDVLCDGIYEAMLINEIVDNVGLEDILNECDIDKIIDYVINEVDVNNILDILVTLDKEAIIEYARDLQINKVNEI